MRKLILLAFVFFCSMNNFAQFNFSPNSASNWEGNWWSFNINNGTWFPDSESFSNFSIDDYSVGQIRTIDQVAPGTSINIEAQIIVNSGGTNGDHAFFCIGDGWVSYEGNCYGIVFRDGKVYFYDNNVSDSIGTYNIGELISFMLTFNNDGSITAEADNFSGTLTPTTTVQNARWIIANSNSIAYRGFYLKSVDGSPITNSNWEGNWWSFNINNGTWFPNSESFSNFSIDDYSVGQIRTIDQVAPGTSINIEAQIIVNSGGTNGDHAFFCIGDGWVSYEGNCYGIVFRDGKVYFYDNNVSDSIGTYNIGELISFMLTFNNDGSITAEGDNFSGTLTPTTTVQNARWIIANSNSIAYRGFYLKSVDGSPITNLENADISREMQKNYRLFQNYPNPFNPVTQIKYSIPERSDVTLTVYDVLGKEVATLVNEEKEPGFYTVDFDGSNLASGMYIYRISAGNFVETRKMILMK